MWYILKNRIGEEKIETVMCAENGQLRPIEFKEPQHAVDFVTKERLKKENEDFHFDIVTNLATPKSDELQPFQSGR